MDTIAKNIISLFLFITFLSSLHTTHARDSQSFNKIPTTTTTTNVVPNNQPQDLDFLPENENAYGLGSGQLPPSAAAKTATDKAATPHKYLPKNYNPVAHVTQPEDITNDDDTANYDLNNNYYNNNGPQNYYNTQRQQQEEDEDEPEYRNYPSSTNYDQNMNNNYYYNSRPRGYMSNARFRGRGGATLSGGENYYNFNGGGGANDFEPQGMSDTRLLENGKYFYDVKTEKYSSNHPYERLRKIGARNDDGYYNKRNYNYYYYGNNNNNNENSYEFNSMEEGFQNQDEFQNVENYNMP